MAPRAKATATKAKAAAATTATKAKTAATTTTAAAKAKATTTATTTKAKTTAASKKNKAVNGVDSSDNKANKRTKKENADANANKTNKAVKHKRADSEDVLTEETERPVKKTKTHVVKSPRVQKVPVSKKAATKSVKAPLRERAEIPMNVFVTGTGEMGELGLGPNVGTVKRPRLNPYLKVDEVGVVEVAVGGMHTAVLTKEGKVLTWGVNDHGALGRDTAWEAPEVSADAEESDSEDEPELEMNPLESTPAPVEGLPKDSNIVELACSDSLSIAVTDAGHLYAWGTFRCSTGILGFSSDKHVADRPVFLPEAKDIIQVVTGTDHILALSKNGTMFAWGNGEQNQLGRRIIERTKTNSLKPREIRIPRNKVRSIGAGSYHCLAVTTEGKVYAWGLNQYGQCGIDDGSLGQDSVNVPAPTLVKSLSKYTNIIQITAGEHHSCAVTEDGKLLAWGRVDGDQLGIKHEDLPKESTIFDERGKPRIVTVPTVVKGLPPVASVSCGTHHTIAICKDGTAYSWGFNNMAQAGQGPDESDILFPTVIMNTAVKSHNLRFAGCGGQFTVLAGVPKGESANADNASSTASVSDGATPNGDSNAPNGI